MFVSIERTLYALQLMLIFGELHRIASNRMLDRRQKRTTAQDLAPPCASWRTPCWCC